MLEVNKIYNGDCLDLMKEIPDKSVDAIICDLPYGTTACSWDSIIPFDKLWEQYKRIRKDNAPIVLFGSEPFSTYLRMSNIKEFKYDWIWEKHKPSNFAQAKKQPLRYSENISVFYKKFPTYNPQKIPRVSDRFRKGKEKGEKGLTKNFGELNNLKTIIHDYTKYDADFKYPSSIIKIPAVVGSSREKVNHPTQKPIKLLEYLIKTYSNEDDLILDNCSGSGSLAIAAYNLKRNFICIEKDIDYYNASVERLKNAQAQLRLF